MLTHTHTHTHIYTHAHTTADVDIMLKPPRDPQEQLITPWVYVRYLVIGEQCVCVCVCV